MSSTLLPPHANSFVIGPEVIKHTHIRSPIGVVVGSCTNHPGVLASIPKREETGKTGAPCVKVPGSSRVPSDPLSAWWLGLAPATLEFWVRFPNEKNQGKQAHPVLKYRVPHGSQPRPGWAPDPLMVGIIIGLVVGSCNQPPWGFGFDSQTRGTRENRRTL